MNNNTATTSHVAPVVPPVLQDSAVTWDVDTSHATAAFKVRHLMLAHVRGQLGPVTGSAFIDEQDLARSRVDISIDARGVDTREPKRDEHLRSADFFDVATHPTVTFKSTNVEAPRGLAGDLRVTGDLTIRGVTRPITLEVEALGPTIKDPWGNARRGVSARGRLNRKDWGLKWNLAIEAGGVAVGDEVAIEIEVELVARKA
jgi:polyisoprenoid-binding protein YceI